MLSVDHLTVRFGNLGIVDDVSFTVGEGEWLMLVGPNGAGKSTIINALSQGVAYKGSAVLDGRNISEYKPGNLAKKLGVLMQSHSVGYSFTVEEVVRLGRYAFSKGIFSTGSDEDDVRVREALDMTGMSGMKDNSVLTLSGGELQRTFLAQLIAQNPNLMMLDEPSNHLDLVYQKQVFDLMRDWLMGGGRALISVVHDLSLAKAYGTHALLLNKGKQAAFGRVEEALTGENLNDVYDMNVMEWMRDMYAQWRI